jgi:L-alanine-DL-glutamate epimerase-like enolase superfamily enzyme
VKIVGAQILEYYRRLDGRSWNPVSRWTERRAPLVVLHADGGDTGIGEAWSQQASIQEGLDALVRCVESFVVGRTFVDENAIRALAARRSETGWAAAAAASAVDIALWDLLAGSRGEPLWRALGGGSDRVRVYASGGLYRDGAGLDELRAEIGSYVRAGFRDVKIKVGGTSLDGDVERIQAARSTMASDGALWVDAVNQLSAANAVEFARAYRAAGATALQAPVPFEDLATMAAITRDGLPVIAAESVFATREFEALLAREAVGFLQFNLGLCGGFSAAAGLAHAAAARSIPVTPQTHATAVLQAAALHCGAAIPGTHSVECHQFHDHLAHLLPAAARSVVDGMIALGAAPGLGVTVSAIGEQAGGGVIRVHRTL